MSEFTKSAARLDQLAEDYRITGLSIKCANAELVEIIVGISTRIQQEPRRNEDHARELRATVGDTANRSPIVRKMAAQELERLEAVTPKITPEERQMFRERMDEANAAVSEMKQLELRLTTARRELRQQIDEDFKLLKIYPLDAQLLSRNIEDKQAEFLKRFGEG
ncbi:MAG: hypothetical protein LUE16_04635 [Lachnospiraceae bacterium]|nr:hypothetical protein [Lachnospiraceae bacterium]